MSHHICNARATIALRRLGIFAYDVYLTQSLLALANTGMQCEMILCWVHEVPVLSVSGLRYR